MPAASTKLGADRRQIQRLILGVSLRLTSAGLGLGLIGTLLVARWVESQLFGVSATDLPSYVLVSIAAVVPAMVATWAPANVASCVDPAVTLRTE